MALARTRVASDNRVPADATWLLSIRWVFPEASENVYHGSQYTRIVLRQRMRTNAP